MNFLRSIVCLTIFYTVNGIANDDRGAAHGAEPTSRPNILLILADDLGYSDLGCYGGEIQTPNLDSLAVGGLRYSQFYNTGRCWPTRAALMTGYYPQSVRRDRIFGEPGPGMGQRPVWAPLVCQPLKAAGYRTYHTGKWHLDGMPIETGFDRSYNLQDQNRFFNPTKHSLDDKPLPAVPKESGYYATVELGDHALECLRQHAQDHSGTPFFHYLAFTSPHFPLQALPEDIDRYRETYRAGWDVVREQRWKRIQELGLVDADLSQVMYDIGPPYPRPDDITTLGDGEVNRPRKWSELTSTQQKFQATKMMIHAAMVDCMDRQVGRVLDQLRKMNALDNTLIFFLSDNGASAEIMVRGDGHDPAAPMGSWASHLCLGPGWSTVSNTPLRYHKTWTHEGGTATPLIVHWPDGIASRNEVRHTAGHVIDIWPTLFEILGIVTDQQTFQRPGQSIVRSFNDDTLSPRKLWWSHEGNRALRQGNWKISAAGKDGAWELFDIDQDRTETSNLAEIKPEILDDLRESWHTINDQNAQMSRTE